MFDNNHVFVISHFYLDIEPVECKKLTSKDTGIYADDFEELDEGDYSDDFESSVDDESEDEDDDESDKNHVKYFLYKI